ncbi:zf-RVT domain-containing protein [Cucumis melo var. makuwa]|uniref:Zf-RVT domain-containing protein n=1 Tax=Cucumis melo var. makuwa TaxID=1194695 RepID=A0A5A7SWE6_CUCMM|nr:zf-RVT domain-containing protein [Cucumis melo var. makuwa]TYK30944.1 zf-RVT domain-containing protein [Cucumis melo var. makuwa]
MAILCQRDRLKRHVWIEVGDGKQCRMWLDLWLQGGPILKRVGERVLFNAVMTSSHKIGRWDVELSWVCHQLGRV